jgi:uncharacterized protein (TIGR02453 family)
MSHISKDTLSFLVDLNQNNNKAWFDQYKDRYETSRIEMAEFADQVIDLVNGFDVLETSNGKKSLHRIYRDVRFSKDKSPYKTYWGGYLKRAGAQRRGGLGFRIEPGNKSMIGGGFWGPNKEDLLLIRKQIEADASPLRNAISTPEFKAYYHNLNGEQLKTAPKGFEKDHPEIDLLRYKQFIVSHSFTDEEVLSGDFAQKVAHGFQVMMPFLNAMTEYLTTDLNGVSLFE